MRIPNASTLFLVITLCCSIAKGQDKLKDSEAKATKKDIKVFNVLSMDGKAESVKIIPDYENHVLTITCSGHTITITDFWGVPPEMRLLNKNFIEIKYDVRGGSGVGLGNIMIVCVNEKRLYEAIHVLRYMNGVAENEDDDYHIKLLLNGHNKNDFRLTAFIYDAVRSKTNPEINYIYNNRTILNFDTRSNVFYNIKDDQYNYKYVTKEGKWISEKKGGVYPAIILGKDLYYFINGKWYSSGKSKELVEI